MHIKISLVSEQKIKLLFFKATIYWIIISQHFSDQYERWHNVECAHACYDGCLARGKEITKKIVSDLRLLWHRSDAFNIELQELLVIFNHGLKSWELRTCGSLNTHKTKICTRFKLYMICPSPHPTCIVENPVTFLTFNIALAGGGGTCNRHLKYSTAFGSIMVKSLIILNNFAWLSQRILSMIVGCLARF